MRYYPLLLLAILLPLAVVAASSGLVFAQSSCPVQVGSASAVTTASGVQVTVPVSVNCANANTLFAVGNIYDTVTNSNLGSTSIAMNWNNGYYSGNLVFTVPTSVYQQQLQVQVSVYNSFSNGQFGGLVATSSSTVITLEGTSPSYYNNYPYSSSCSYGYYGYYSNYYGSPYYNCGYSYSYPYYYNSYSYYPYYYGHYYYHYYGHYHH